MGLPVRTEYREDGLHLERAVHNLLEAHKSLKKYLDTELVNSNPNLAKAARKTKRRTKELLSRAKALAEMQVLGDG